MGKTSFSGPVYGAKSQLWSLGPFTSSTGASTIVIANRTIPPYEDWFITEFHLTCSTCSSVGNSWILKSEGGSTTGISRAPGGYPSTVAQTIFTINSGTSTSVSTNGTATASAGEYEGVYVPAGSSMRLVSSGVNPVANLCVQIMGYIRFVSSTRSEG